MERGIFLLVLEEEDVEYMREGGSLEVNNRSRWHAVEQVMVKMGTCQSSGEGMRAKAFTQACELIEGRGTGSARGASCHTEREAWFGKIGIHHLTSPSADSRNGYQDVFSLPSCMLQVWQRWPLRRGLL